MKNIEHIGIAVKDFSAANGLFYKLLNTEPYKTEVVVSEQVSTSFFRIGESKIELLEPLTDDSPMARYLEKHGEGIHHIAFAVDDILAEMDRLKKEGFKLLSDIPKPGADNKLVCFVHPKSANGILIELCQEIK